MDPEKLKRALRELRQLNEEIDRYQADERAREERESEQRRELTRYLTGTIFDPPMPRGISVASRQILERNWREEDSPLSESSGSWRDAGGGDRIAPSTPHDIPIKRQDLRNWTPPTLTANPHSSSLGLEPPTTSVAQSTRSNSEPSDYDIETDTLSSPKDKPASSFGWDSDSLKAPGFGWDSQSLKSPRLLADLNGEGVGQLSQTFVSPISNIAATFMPTPTSVLPPITPLPQAAVTAARKLATPATPDQQSQPIAPTPNATPAPSIANNGPFIQEYKPTQVQLESNLSKVQNKLDFLYRFTPNDTDSMRRAEELRRNLEWEQRHFYSDKYPQSTTGTIKNDLKAIGGALYESADQWAEQKQTTNASRPINFGNNRRSNYIQRPPTTIRAPVRGGGS